MAGKKGHMIDLSGRKMYDHIVSSGLDRQGVTFLRSDIEEVIGFTMLDDEKNVRTSWRSAMRTLGILLRENKMLIIKKNPKTADQYRILSDEATADLVISGSRSVYRKARKTMSDAETIRNVNLLPDQKYKRLSHELALTNRMMEIRAEEEVRQSNGAILDRLKKGDAQAIRLPNK